MIQRGTFASFLFVLSVAALLATLTWKLCDRVDAKMHTAFVEGSAAGGLLHRPLPAFEPPKQAKK